MVLPKVEIPSGHPPQAHESTRSASENCARIKRLGFVASKHIKMYGEEFQLVSDPFVDGDCTSVHAITRKDPAIRTLRLPITLLAGLSYRFLQSVKVAGEEVL